jgi:hypothetical protein
MNDAILDSGSARFSKFGADSRFRWRIENCCSIWFIHNSEQAEVKLEAGMLIVPRANLLALVHDQVVANDVNVRDRIGGLSIDLIQQSDKVLLTLPLPTNSDDRSRPGVERSEQLRSPFSLVLVFQPHRNVRRLCRERRSGAGARLQLCLLVHAKDSLTRHKVSGVELAETWTLVSGKLYLVFV